MGAASSALNSVENEIAARELAKPLDGSDVAHSPTAALEEVKRLRKELRRCLDKEDFKKRKNHNKWRRGSFGQIGKAEDFWEKQERDAARGKTESEAKQEEPKPPTAVDENNENVEEMMLKMNAEMSVMLAPTPKAAKGRNGFGEAEGAGGEGGGEEEGGKKRTQRRSFVLEPGLTLVDSDEDE